MRILAVDDDKITRKLISMFLSKLGLNCELAANVDEALEILGEFHPNLIFSDWLMPGKTGMDLCQYIRNSYSYEQPLIVCLSGLEHEDDIAAAKQAGVDLFLHKPIRLDSLIRCIKLSARILAVRNTSNLSPIECNIIWSTTEHDLILAESKKMNNPGVSFVVGLLKYSGIQQEIVQDILNMEHMKGIIDLSPSPLSNGLFFSVLGKEREEEITDILVELTGVSAAVSEQLTDDEAPRISKIVARLATKL